MRAGSLTRGPVWSLGYLMQFIPGSEDSYLESFASAVGMANGVLLLLRYSEQWFAWFITTILYINMNRGTFTFITAIQDETHRFANAYRKQQMKQKSYSSTLTEVPGVGPKTAKALLAQFKSVGAVKDATPDQLENTPGVGRQLAQTIYDYFHREA